MMTIANICIVLSFDKVFANYPDKSWILSSYDIANGHNVLIFGHLIDYSSAQILVGNHREE